MLWNFLSVGGGIVIKGALRSLYKISFWLDKGWGVGSNPFSFGEKFDCSQEEEDMETLENRGRDEDKG